ncbi:MAG: hypothetical protein WD772_05495, partial [Pseudohongiellaceae bacterium]
MQVARSGILVYSPLSLKLLLCVILLFVPFLYNNSDPAMVSDRFLGLVAGLLLFWSLQQFDFSGKERSLFLFMVLGAVMIEALIGWVQIIANANQYDIVPYNNPSPAGVFQQVNVMSSFLAT